MNKKVLLLGGSGLLSYATLKEALRCGWQVTILNRGSHNADIPREVVILKCDFMDANRLREVLMGKEFDVVVDFLSREPLDIQRVFPILSQACKQFVFISSACVYRRSKEDFPIREDSLKPNRQGSYNVEKWECEETLRTLTVDWCGFYTIVRPYITYDLNRVPYGIAPHYEFHLTLLERLRHGKPLCLWNQGDAKVTLTYVDDFAKGLVGLFMNDSAVNEDFHITSDYTYTWKEVLEVLSDKLGVPFRYASCSSAAMSEVMPDEKDMLEGDRCLDAVFDNSKIKKAVPNLVFETDLEKGMEMLISHYNQQNEYRYDYKYEALMDRLCTKQKIRVHYVKYPHAKASSLVVYLLYRYLPYRKARKVARRLKI